jgi:hypothetical protein
VNDYQWFNRSQPQTLQYAVMLGYIEAVLGLVLRGWFLDPIMLAVMVAIGVGSFGIANEKKWGYTTAVVGAVAYVLALLAFGGADTLQDIGLLINFMFAAALLLLLIHPMSRDYQRIWFK